MTLVVANDNNRWACATKWDERFLCVVGVGWTVVHKCSKTHGKNRDPYRIQKTEGPLESNSQPPHLLRRWAMMPHG